MTDTITTETVTVRGWRSGVEGTVTASYHGGAYIELGFGGHAPTEVLNVWSYEDGGPTGEFSRWDNLSSSDRHHALTFEVQSWIRGLVEEGWGDWYECYLANV